MARACHRQQGSYLETSCGVTLMAKRPLKLDRLPNRKPVKLTITLEPETFDALEDYARIYAEEYGDEESVNVIASYMIGDFMEGDAAFKRRRKKTEPPFNPLQNGQLE